MYFDHQGFIVWLKYSSIMLALCSMLSGTYYAQNYDGIIGGSLGIGDIPCLITFYFYDPLSNPKFLVPVCSHGNFITRERGVKLT